MKSKTKKLVALSLTATLCGALATFATLTNPKEASASATTTFKMADGAGIRYTSEDGKKEGLRFIVLADETTKNAIVNSGTIGFVATAAQNFAGVDSDYKMEMSEYVREFPVTANDFYQNAEEYGDLYCANVVINMGTNDTVENFTERTYSAVAYYATGTDTYAYTENRQERSIQDVASKLYIQGDEDWSKVKEAYTEIGTENTPFLVAQSGKNSYKSVVGRFGANKAFGDGLCFTLAEDLIAETDLANEDAFKGEFIDSEYTATFATGVNTGMIAIGGNNNFLYGEVDESAAENYEVNVSFDETKKYDSASKGSYKAEFKVKNGGDTSAGAAYLRLKMNPVYSKSYYDALKEAGYNKIAVRFFLDTMNISSNKPNQAGIRYINGSTEDAGKTEMQIYVDNEAKTNKPSTFILWNEDLKVANGEWAEIVLDMEKFAQNYYDGMTLFMMQASANYDLNTTMYIDNIYAVKGSVIETVAQEKAMNSTVELNSLFNVDTTTGDEWIYAGYGADDKALDISSGSITVSKKGGYSISATARNYYGKKKVIVYTKPDNDNYDVVADYLLSIDGASAAPIVSYGGDGAVYNDAFSYDTGNYCAILNLQYDYVYTDISIVPAANKAYYQALKAKGYKYLTIRMRYRGANTRLAAGVTSYTHYNQVPADSGIYSVAADGTETAVNQISPWGTGTTQNYSINIDKFIESFDGTGKVTLFRILTISKNSVAQPNTLFLKKVAVTKDGQLS